MRYVIAAAAVLGALSCGSNALAQAVFSGSQSSFGIDYSGGFLGFQDEQLPCSFSLSMATTDSSLENSDSFLCSYSTSPIGPSSLGYEYTFSSTINDALTNGTLIITSCNFETGVLGNRSASSENSTARLYGGTEVTIDVPLWGDLSVSGAVNFRLDGNVIVSTTGTPTSFVPDGSPQPVGPGLISASITFDNTISQSPANLEACHMITVQFLPRDPPTAVDINDDREFTEADLCAWRATPTDVNQDGLIDDDDYRELLHLLERTHQTLTDTDSDRIPDACDPSLCPADVNNDGVVDNGDIGSFVTLFLAQDPAADFTDDGIIDNGDITAFVAAFLAGC
ncbi:MAG: GC-type dockerin domain-anchored protein [Phycisphaerales bacterium JB040]